jgi:hypothetical protein
MGHPEGKLGETLEGVKSHAEEFWDWFFGERKERHRHFRELLVFFVKESEFRNLEGQVMSSPVIVAQLLSNDLVGINLLLTELSKGAVVPLSKGPFTVAVQDLSNTVSYTPGSADETTPDNFKANGTGNTGLVTVTVTDTSQTPPLFGVGTFNVVAPPPAVPDTLEVQFTPATPPVVQAAAAAKPAA